MTVDTDPSRVVLLSLLDQIEQLLGDVRTAIVHKDAEDGDQEQHD